MKKTLCVKCNANVILTDRNLCPKCGEIGVDRMLSESLNQTNHDFAKIIEKLNAIHDNNLPETDLRWATIVVLRDASLWAAMQVKTYPSLMMKKNSPVPQYLKSLQPVSDDSIKRLVFNFDLMNRSSYLTMFLFQVEVFFRGVNSILKNKCTNCGYRELTKHVLKELKIPNDNNEKLDILNIPALVRNCLHAHGIHNKNDEHGKIDGILFKFEKGKRPGYIGWEHVCFFCDKLLEVIGEVLKSPLVKRTQIPWL